ncbi:alpha-L-fucosidase [Mucilaginibacter terrae]|uniref:alpha-L-fucosidase n=1 Tax=Mucilaginibacter terrae TaxID=1955052 RepID=UPI003634DAAB
MKRRTILKSLGLSTTALMLNKHLQGFPLDGLTSQVPAKGPFQPTWESLQNNYRTPNWFSKAKFGMWAHWGPQCQPEAGDFYARNMYVQGSKAYNIHVSKYGHPSKVGFKDVIKEWKAENWDPDALVKLYKSAGAQYFVAMANHCDNMDLYKSKHQKNWNSTKLGPKKDIIAEWSQAAKRHQLPFGVSVHAAHAWIFMETAQHADKTGPLAGVPYDGKLQKANGAGQWWNGLDPQELYEQNHPLSENSDVDGILNKQWRWINGASKPSQAYIKKYFDRTLDLIDSYGPDLVYFDDPILPLWPMTDDGLKIAAHLYNKSLKDHGELRAVMTMKGLDSNQRKGMVWDIERGLSNEIEPLPWQTDTCIGNWHYHRGIYESKAYKSAKTIIQMMVDIVSKNGNLLLNIPVRADGTIDEIEQGIVEEIGRWMKANSESIYDTVPWRVFGEGPALEAIAELKREGFNEGKGKPFTAEDIRFASKGSVVYATIMGWPESGKTKVKSLGKNSDKNGKKVESVQLLSTKQKLVFEQKEDALYVTMPDNKPLEYYANALKIQC